MITSFKSSILSKMCVIEDEFPFVVKKIRTVPDVIVGKWLEDKIGLSVLITSSIKILDTSNSYLVTYRFSNSEEAVLFELSY